MYGIGRGGGSSAMAISLGDISRGNEALGTIDRINIIYSILIHMMQYTNLYLVFRYILCI